MLIAQLIKKTLPLQGFCVAHVAPSGDGLVVVIVPDARYSPRCGRCGTPGAYRDRRRTRRFQHVPLWGIPVMVFYAPRRVWCGSCEGVHVEAMPWTAGKRRMTTIDIDVALTDEMREVRDTVHRFAAEVMRPAAAKLDRLDDPSDVIAKESPLWDVMKRFKQLGIGDPAKYGADLSPTERALLHSVVRLIPPATVATARHRAS